MHVSYHFWAFFWLALRTLTFGGFYMNYNMEAKSLTFRRGSEVSQVLVFLATKDNPMVAYRITLGSKPSNFDHVEPALGSTRTL